MKEAEINDQGLVECPNCLYRYDADPEEIILCEHCLEVFKAVPKAAA